MDFTDKHVASVVIAFVVFFFSHTVTAEVPETLTYNGTIKKDGTPYDGMVEASFELYTDETGGQPIWSERHPSLQVQDGQFIAELGSVESLKDVFDGEKLWLEITIEGNTMQPRQQIGSVPYAKRAGVAAKAENAEKIDGKNIDQLSTGDSAKDISYDASNAELTASNVKQALDKLSELKTEVANLRTQLENSSGNLVDISGLEQQVSKLSTDLQNKAEESQLTNYLKKSDASSTYAKQSTLQQEYVTQSSASSTYANQSDLSAIDGRVAAMETKTQDIERTKIDNKQSLVFEGINLHLRDGSGKTYGTGNGLGNLIVGYNGNPITSDTDDSGGSHNIVVGDDHSYSQDAMGGLIVGKNHEVDGKGAAITGGKAHRVAGIYGWIGGGKSNRTLGKYASVSGGSGNDATEKYASVTGGTGNKADATAASITGA